MVVVKVVVENKQKNDLNTLLHTKNDVNMPYVFINIYKDKRKKVLDSQQVQNGYY